MPAATLDSLFQNMGPTFAASAAGTQLGQEQGLNTLEAMTRASAIAKSAQDYNQAQQMNPMLLQARQADTARTQALTANEQAQNPGLAAASRSLGVKANIDEATQGSKTAADNSSNNLLQAQNKVKFLDAHFQETVDAASKISAAAAQTPGGGKAALDALQQDPNVSEETKHLLANTPIDKLPDVVQKMSEYKTKASSAYQTELMKEVQNTGRTVESHQIMAQASVDVANIHRETSLAVEEARAGRAERAKQLMQTVNQKIADWETKPDSDIKTKTLTALRSDLQTANATWATAVNLAGLQAGNLNRNVPGISPTSDKPAPGQQQTPVPSTTPPAPAGTTLMVDKAGKIYHIPNAHAADAINDGLIVPPKQ